ncbi:peroxiredoxin-like family protein [Leeuwenhoekiella sp. W20_SRS_FM14]|uniref:peroxiredoxin-like family protein n=1 Tax=Leeuwenhoekiella sp. W20_SRS_FM14 TaxID=3240270 RepID=UPI003F96C344
MIKPDTQVPELEIDLINDTTWKLSAQKPEKYTLIVFYRGLHCPICKKQLQDLTSKTEDLKSRGVNIIAISMDTQKRAKLSQEKWETGNLPIGYGLSEDKARDWGLYISHAVKDAEPDVFSEPGMFLVRADGTLYFSSIQTMPFARPDLEAVLKSIDFVEKEDYPARGGK